MLLATQADKGSPSRTHGRCEQSLLFVAITMAISNGRLPTVADVYKLRVRK